MGKALKECGEDEVNGTISTRGERSEVYTRSISSWGTGVFDFGQPANDGNVGPCSRRLPMVILVTRMRSRCIPQPRLFAARDKHDWCEVQQALSRSPTPSVHGSSRRLFGVVAIARHHFEKNIPIGTGRPDQPFARTRKVQFRAFKPQISPAL